MSATPLSLFSASPKTSCPVTSLPEIDEVCLRQMPFSAFVQTVANLLAELGYKQVTIVKPLYSHSKGRTTHGGRDIEALFPASGGRVVVQVKQYKLPVPRAFVDELRGTMLRLNARQGLLITTSSFSAAAIAAAQAGQQVAPIKLIAGEKLVALLHAQPTATSTVQQTAGHSPALPPLGKSERLLLKPSPAPASGSPLGNTQHTTTGNGDIDHSGSRVTFAIEIGIAAIARDICPVCGQEEEEPAATPNRRERS